MICLCTTYDNLVVQESEHQCPYRSVTFLLSIQPQPVPEVSLDHTPDPTHLHSVEPSTNRGWLLRGHPPTNTDTTNYSY